MDKEIIYNLDMGKVVAAVLVALLAIAAAAGVTTMILTGRGTDLGLVRRVGERGAGKEEATAETAEELEAELVDLDSELGDLEAEFEALEQEEKGL